MLYASKCHEDSMFIYLAPLVTLAYCISKDGKIIRWHERNKDLQMVVNLLRNVSMDISEQYKARTLFLSEVSTGRVNLKNSKL